MPAARLNSLETRPRRRGSCRCNRPAASRSRRATEPSRVGPRPCAASRQQASRGRQPEPALPAAAEPDGRAVSCALAEILEWLRLERAAHDRRSRSPRASVAISCQRHRMPAGCVPVLVPLVAGAMVPSIIPKTPKFGWQANQPSDVAGVSPPLACMCAGVRMFSDCRSQSFRLRMTIRVVRIVPTRRTFRSPSALPRDAGEPARPDRAAEHATPDNVGAGGRRRPDVAACDKGVNHAEHRNQAVLASRLRRTDAGGAGQFDRLSSR